MQDVGKRRKFRSLLEGNGCVYTASVFDPVSALIAEDLGFEVGLLGGSIASMAVLGAPDAYILTLSELVEQVRRITRVGNIPLLVDGDHGYGNALSTFRTVEELAAAGATAVTIEDTLLPPPYGASGAETLVSIEEAAARMRAAVAARGDSGIVILGRTSAPGLTSVADTIARCAAFADAGVDALFLRSFRSVEDFDAIARAVTLPLVVDPGLASLRDLSRLASAGVRVALQGHEAFTAAALAIRETLAALRNGASPDEVKSAQSAQMVARISRADEYTRQSRLFLGRGPDSK